MPKDLHFKHDLTVALEPGSAAVVRGGEVLTGVADDVAARLLKRDGVSLADPKADVRRVSFAEAKGRLSQTAAALVSPLLDPQRLIDDRKRLLESRKALADYEREIAPK